MARYRVEVSEPAENDLRDIVRYIFAQLSAPVAATKLMDAIEDAIAGLAEIPHSCALVTDEWLASMGYRKLVVKNYLVFFTIDERAKVVAVERIPFARRNWLHIL